jgi:hypothetical protein
MPNPPSRVSQALPASRRTYGGEEQTEFLIEYLNESPIPTMIGILRDVQRLSELGKQATHKYPGEVAFRNPQQEAEYDMLWKRIHAEFEKFHFYPRLTRQKGNRWETAWAHVHIPPAKGRPFHPDLPYPIPDAMAFRAIVLTAERGFLHRVRQCTQCRNWFYARFKHQEYCRTECQQKHYKASDEWKEHRREYMRGYRQLTEAKRFK